MSATYYETLEVPRTASHDEIKKAYRRKARAAHPDRNAGDDAAMKDLNAAWECLGDPVRRLTYDQTGTDLPNSIESEARGVLVNVIGQVLAADVETGILDTMRTGLREMRDKLDRLRGEQQDAIKKLERRREKLRRKKRRGKKATDDDQPNLFHAVIDKMIETARANAGRAERGIEVHTAALKMLDEYESDEQMPSIIFRNVSSSGATSSAGAWKFGTM